MRNVDRKYYDHKESIVQKRLNQLRTETGLPSMAVAKQAGIDPASLRKYECGMRLLNKQCANLYKLAAFYNVLPEYILGGEHRTNMEKIISKKREIDRALGNDIDYMTDEKNIQEMASHLNQLSQRTRIHSLIHKLYLSDLFPEKPAMEYSASELIDAQENTEFLEGLLHLDHDIDEYIKTRTEQFRKDIKFMNKD